MGFVPVAVSVPANVALEIEMSADNWAFGSVDGKPRDEASLQ